MKPPHPAGHLNWILYKESDVRWVLTRRVPCLPCSLPPLSTVFSNSKESASRSIQGLTLTCTSEVTRRQVGDAVCSGKKNQHSGSVYPLFCASEHGASYLSLFQKADFKNAKETQKRHLLFAVVGLTLTRLMTTITDYYKIFFPKWLLLKSTGRDLKLS